MAWTIDALVGKPNPKRQGETGVESTSGGCEYEDVFQDELPGLPPYRDVDFTIELHPGTSPISMTPHRMVPAKLQELKVQVQNCWTEVREKPTMGPDLIRKHLLTAQS